MKPADYPAIEYTDSVEAGDLLMCRYSGEYHYWLTPGATYECIHGLEEGIFEDRPFVTVLSDNTHKRVTAHASRFTKVTGMVCPWPQPTL